MQIKGFVTAFGLAFAAPIASSMALANCVGQNLFEIMPEAEQKEVRARADAVPFASGNLWQATKDDQKLTIVGTYHLEDERHAATLEKLAPYWEDAKGVLVEATREDELALQKAIAERPELIFLTEGPSLIEQLPPELWEKLSQSMSARGIPSVMAAKYQPWFAVMTLGFAPCAMQAIQEGGLDRQVLDEADKRQLPTQALEPYETLFTLFAELPPEEPIRMMEVTLALEDRNEDIATTLADLYFQGESRLLWEMNRELYTQYTDLTRPEIDKVMGSLEEIMMTGRNEKWIPVLEEAAAKGPQIAAFGALHLSGETGVLALLEQKGWKITPIQ